MEKILNNEAISYERKMKLMVSKYERLVDKMSKEIFRVRLPENYEVKMSDYNDFYNITEKKSLDIFENRME